MIPLNIYSDADWAGCRETRRSTIGGCVMLRTHIIKGWSKTQSLAALSSGELELYATLKVAAGGLGITAMLSDLGVHAKGEIWGDATAALGIINRNGLGKTRHIETGYPMDTRRGCQRQIGFPQDIGQRQSCRSLHEISRRENQPLSYQQSST